MSADMEWKNTKYRATSRMDDTNSGWINEETVQYAVL